MPEEYPKWMEHPGFQPAVIHPDNPRLNTSMRYGPITVSSKDEEEERAAMGYRPVGVYNPKAYESVKAGMETKAAYVHQEYPKWVGDKIANNEEEERKLLSAATRTVEVEPVRKVGRPRKIEQPAA